MQCYFRSFPLSKSGRHFEAPPGICSYASPSSASPPLTDTLVCFFFFFFFYPTAPVLGCQTPQSVTLLPSLQRNNSHCDKGSHDVALRDPHMWRQVGQAFILVGDKGRTSWSRICGNMIENSSFFFSIYFYEVCIRL